MSAELLTQVRSTLAARSAAGADVPTPAQVAAALPAEGRLLGDAGARGVVDEIRQELLGAGPLEPLLHLPGVTDVLVHGPDRVFVDRGAGLEQVEVRFPDEAAVRRLAQRWAAASGRRLDDGSPFVDARLSDGTRFHAVLAPVAPHGTCISLRLGSGQGSERVLALDDLVESGAIPLAGAELLRAIVRARLGFLVTGAAGSGKSTVLAAMLALVDPTERIVLVEDVEELDPDHPHVVHLEGRPPNVEGAGEISIRTLVRQALRMRPDRLIVGEVRGAEVVDLLAALNTGHDGGCGTLHANRAADVAARVEALGVAAGLGRLAVHSQLAAAVHVVIQLARRPDGARVVAEVALLERSPDGLVRVVPAVRFVEGVMVETAAFAALRARLDGGGEP